MERKLMEMLDKVEVPVETSKKVEELLMRELVHKNSRNVEENKRKSNKEDVRMNAQLASKKGNVLRIMGGSAAALAITAGLATGIFALKGTTNKSFQVASITASPQVTSRVTDRTCYSLKEGKNYIDLDLDGNKEEIELKNTATGTSTVDFEITIGDEKIKGSVDREEGLKLRATALTKEADSVQLMFTYQYLSDDYLTNVYNYENKKLVKVGTFCDEVDRIKLTDDGSFIINQPGGILGEWKDTTVRMVENNHNDADITGKYCLEETTQFDHEISFKYSITALQNVDLYKSMDRNGGSVTQIKTGEKAETIKVIDGKWLYLETESGEKGYLELNLEDFIIDGNPVIGWEVFEGLPYAG
ncbi:MAG: hypothetical protein Q4F05_13235 [bacterium]|nr:hypothetical protein [bacterium]